MRARGFISHVASASVALVVVGLLAAFPVARAASDTVVISQVYAGGGEAGAAFQNDYVVLFNNGSTSIDVSTWSLQVEVSGPVGPTWEVTPLCGLIPHGEFYLVALASSGPPGGPLPGADCAGSTNLPSDTGKIALVNGTAPLVGTCPITDATVVDFLGYGSRGGCSEGSAAVSPDPTTALFRSPAAPCVDTDDNGSDFSLGTPAPMNTSSPANGCNNASPTVASIPPQSVNELATLVVTPSGSDPNGDLLSWSGSNLPVGSSVAPATGELTWSPGGVDAGFYAGVLLTADDGLGGSGSASFDISVADATTPVVDPIADQVVPEGSSVTVIASASDADGDPLTFSHSPLLPWITQAPMTSEFTMAPGHDVAGPGGAAFGITVEASDGTNTGTASFSVHVVNVTTAANTPHAAMTWPEVSAATGELSFVEMPDLCLGGANSLCFRRYYASLLDREGEAQGTLGANWLGTYDWTLVETPTEAKVVDPRGRIYRFASGVGGSWTLVEPQDAPYELTDLGAEFSFAHARLRAFYIIDRTTASLTRIEDGRGNVHTLSYVGGELSTVSDGLGRTLTLTHDGSGRVTSVTDGTRTVTYGYTGPNLTSVTDAESKTTTYQYDAAHAVPGLLTAVVDASGGNSLQYQYDAEGNVSQVQIETGMYGIFQRQGGTSPTQLETDVQWPDGGVHQYVHDSFGRLTQYTDPQSGTTTATYDSRGRLASYTRPSTITPLTVGYDPVSGFPATLTLSDTNAWQIAYVARSFTEGRFYFPTSVQAPDLGQITYSYDGVGNLTQITDQESHSWTMTYNGFGQPLTITNPTSGVMTYTYDASGRPLTANDGAGTTQFIHDALDQLTTITHPDLSTRTYTWNGRGQLLTRTNELSKTWTYAYRDNGQLQSVTDPLLATTTLGYDARNRLTQVTDALSGVTTIAYHPTWRIASVTDPTLRAVNFQYDLLGRLTGATDPGGQTTTYGYDADSRLTSITDPLTHTWSYAYNGRDQLTSATDPLINTTSYTYDSVGRLTAINRPLGLTTSHTYDLRGLRTSATTGPVSVGYSYTPLGQLGTYTDGESHAWTRTHDPMGRLTVVTDPLLRSTTFGYDNRNRPTGIIHPEGTVTFTYNSASQLTQRSYSDGTVHNYTYDDVGRMLTTEEVTRTYDLLGRITEENGILYGYDAAGRLQTETFSAGHEIGHNFGLRGLPSQTTDWLSGVTTYTFDAAGQLTGLDRPNGTSAEYDYDAAGRLLALREVTVTDTIASVQLTRDALGRVTFADRRTPLSWAPETTSRTYAYDAASQVVGFAYDGSGRLLDDGLRTYAWDGASRADSISEGSAATRYASDGLDRVVDVQRTGASEVVLVSVPTQVFGHKVTDLMAAAGSMLPGAHAEDSAPIGPGTIPETTEGGKTEQLSLIAEQHPTAPPIPPSATGLVDTRWPGSAVLGVVRERQSPGGAATDRTHWVTTPWGAPLHRIDLSGGTPTRRYYHFNEAGNTAFLTNAGGSVVTAYAYSPWGEADAIGELQPYPALTYKGQFGVIEEAPGGLYRVGDSFYDALTAQSSPTHGSCGCKEKFVRSKPHVAPLPSSTENTITGSAPGTGVPIPTLFPEDQPEKIALGPIKYDSKPYGFRITQSPGPAPESHPQEVLDIVAASTGHDGPATQANRRYLYFAKVADVELHDSKPYGFRITQSPGPVPDSHPQEVLDLVAAATGYAGSSSQANRRYLYFAKTAETVPGHHWIFGDDFEAGFHQAGVPATYRGYWKRYRSY